MTLGCFKLQRLSNVKATEPFGTNLGRLGQFRFRGEKIRGNVPFTVQLPMELLIGGLGFKMSHCIGDPTMVTVKGSGDWTQSEVCVDCRLVQTHLWHFLRLNDKLLYKLM